MKNPFLIGVVALLSCGPSAGETANQEIGAPVASPKPVLLSKTTLNIENASDGSCSTLSLISGGRKLISEETCHGWSVEGCDDSLIMVGRGVTKDWAFFSGRNKALSLSELAVDELRTRDPSYEWVHFRVGKIECRESELVMKIEGSVLPKGATGSLHAASGVIKVNGQGEASVEINQD
jgi:hypothetical protein